MDTIYFDNAATTKVSKEAADKAVQIMTELYANPSSVHSFGIRTYKELEAARMSIMSALGFSPGDGDVYFTSGGTEAANLALLGFAHANRRRGKRILVSDSEHPCVNNSMARLADEGFEIVRIPTKGGALDLDFAAAHMNDDVLLISAMSVNNETGAVYDIRTLNDLRKKLAPNAVLHTDGVQAFLKSASPLSASGADLISVSSHKIHAPKGSGALWVRKGVRLSPILFGGEQENSVRPGTEALPTICAFGEAAKNGAKFAKDNFDYVTKLKSYTANRIRECCGEVRFNEPKISSPYILSVVVPGIRSEVMLRFLSDKGIYVSAGSACSSKHRENRVLSAFGLSDGDADSTIRISFSELNTTAEADILAKAIALGKETLIPVRVFKRQ